MVLRMMITFYLLQYNSSKKRPDGERKPSKYELDDYICPLRYRQKRQKKCNKEE